MVHSVTSCKTTMAITVTTSLWIAASYHPVVSAWMMPPPLTSSTLATSKTASNTCLYMFDWMNPNKKPQDEKNSSGDFFGSMFKVKTPPTPSTPEKDEEKGAPDNAVASATVDPPVSTDDKKEEEVVEKDDFIAASFNAEEVIEEKKEEKGPSVDTSSVVTSAATDDDTIHHGKVRWFDPKKGYGFINQVDKEGKFTNSDQEGNTGIFVHQADLVVNDTNTFRRLYGGELVDFHLNKDQNGRLKAINVTGPGGKDIKVVQRQKRVDEHTSEAP
ncbi:cold-shock DNA-binding domain protein [Nitzschia inconspicua]|uniref:Cold-shock DNA-binding domain protein n=1 Tax=Nitzschia inconspicua TaxID=303405 RepID=A0A9K3K7U2_9STRA|nr:cold-shock DNA-binding domain protein [Nitzschia inconspicua]KAG7365933.1 cold-shock DNA-binding domain protein [Nitzschia inconspicua]